MSKRKYNKQKKQEKHKDIKIVAPVTNEDCSCTEPPLCETSPVSDICQKNNSITIYGKVKCNGQGVHLATVSVIRNRQIVAECLTDCEGNYEFNGIKSRYFLRAHKNHRRSVLRSVSCKNNHKFEINFCLH